MFLSSLSPHARAIAQALLVTFLWSTSWVLIKIGLRDEIPALTFAGLRYTLAFLCLAPIALRQRRGVKLLPDLSRRNWLSLIILALLLYTVAQGAQFVSLDYLPAATVNLLLGFSAVVVAGLGIAMLGEQPSRTQWGGLLLYLVGAGIFFYPVLLSQSEYAGVLTALVGVLANSVSSVLGRSLNRARVLPPVQITAMTMGIGGILLLIIGITTQGLPPLSLTSIAIIGWLALVNTAFAFTLWNVTLKTLSALESSIINNAMMIQIPLLAWIFLGEALTEKAAIGLLVAALGILIVQVGRLPLRLSLANRIKSEVLSP